MQEYPDTITVDLFQLDGGGIVELNSLPVYALSALTVKHAFLSKFSYTV